MSQSELPTIDVGQVYLNFSETEYLVVVKNTQGYISYAGANLRGRIDEETFIEKFKPVDPTLISAEDVALLHSLCSTTLKTGWTGN